MLSNSISSSIRYIKIGAVLLGIMTLAACQVKPLYSTSSSGSLPPIEISKADTRVELLVRNHLNFLMEPTNLNSTAEYRLSLNVTSSSTGLLDSGTDNNFTAGTMTVSGSFTFINNIDDEVIFSGRRSAIAHYDLPNQEFAKIRALQDAEDRAGRELAELIKTDILVALQNLTDQQYGAN